MQIVHGSVTSFEINIPDDLHVLGVEGNGIKKWEVVGGKDKTALIQLGKFCSSFLSSLLILYPHFPRPQTMCYFFSPLPSKNYIWRTQFCPDSSPSLLPSPLFISSFLHFWPLMLKLPFFKIQNIHRGVYEWF